MSAGNPWLTATNLLVIRMDNAGDIVMLGPALRAIKATSPEARITLLASPAGSKAAVLLPWIDEVITWRAVWQDLGHLPFDPPRERELIDLLAGHAFDAALIFTSFSQSPHVPGYVCYLAGIPLRAGESHEFGGASLSHGFRGLPDDIHQVDRNLNLVERVGFGPGDPTLGVAIPAASHTVVEHRLRRFGVGAVDHVAVLHPGASARARCYPAERYGEVAALLRERGWHVLLTGSERETDQLEAVCAAAGESLPRLTDLTIQEYAALIAHSSAVVCGNTLPMHLADATGTPVVALYSGTDEISQWRPRRAPACILQRPVPCSPCYLFECPIGVPCLDIAPADVIRGVEALVCPVAARAPREVMA
ncbi:MAG: glycosyltransferase family 9 protein [Chloroflexota bacterium]|nr:glycosyltransferase family 9 protein [Chloroflexota bacterium]